jgi:hypothetical protein
MYFLNKSVSENITATVYDNNNNLVENCFIDVLRYFPGNNSYVTVAQYKTDSQGVAIMDMEKNAEFYKFMLYYPYNTLVYSTSPSYVQNDNINFQINLQELPGLYANYTNNIVSTGITYNNATTEFTYTFANVAGDNTQVKLNVYKKDYLGNDVLINSTSVTSSAATLITSTDNQSQQTYIAKAIIVYNDTTTSTDYIAAAKDINTNQKSVMGTLGLFLVLILTLALCFVAYFSLALAVLVVPIPLLVCAILGFVTFSVPLAIIIEICAVIVAIIIGF